MKKKKKKKSIDPFHGSRFCRSSVARILFFFQRTGHPPINLRIKLVFPTRCKYLPLVRSRERGGKKKGGKKNEGEEAEVNSEIRMASSETSLLLLDSWTLQSFLYKLSRGVLRPVIYTSRFLSK